MIHSRVMSWLPVMITRTYVWIRTFLISLSTSLGVRYLTKISSDPHKDAAAPLFVDEAHQEKAQ